METEEACQARSSSLKRRPLGRLDFRLCGRATDPGDFRAWFRASSAPPRRHICFLVALARLCCRASSRSIWARAARGARGAQRCRTVAGWGAGYGAARRLRCRVAPLRDVHRCGAVVVGAQGAAVGGGGQTTCCNLFLGIAASGVFFCRHVSAHRGCHFHRRADQVALVNSRYLFLTRCALGRRTAKS